MFKNYLFLYMIIIKLIILLTKHYYQDYQKIIKTNYYLLIYLTQKNNDFLKNTEKTEFAKRLKRLIEMNKDLLQETTK